MYMHHIYIDIDTYIYCTYVWPIFAGAEYHRSLLRTKKYAVVLHTLHSFFLVLYKKHFLYSRIDAYIDIYHTQPPLHFAFLPLLVSPYLPIFSPIFVNDIVGRCDHVRDSLFLTARPQCQLYRSCTEALPHLAPSHRFIDNNLPRSHVTA